MGAEFKAIFRDLFHGNINAAEAVTERVCYSNTDYLVEEYERMKQDRINYELRIAKKYA